MVAIKQAWSWGLGTHHAQPWRITDLSSRTSSSWCICRKGQKVVSRSLWNLQEVFSSKPSLNRDISILWVAKSATTCADDSSSSQTPTQEFRFQRIEGVGEAREHTQSNDNAPVSEAAGVIRFEFADGMRPKGSAAAERREVEGAVQWRPKASVAERLPSHAAGANDVMRGGSKRNSTSLRPKPSRQESTPQDLTAANNREGFAGRPLPYDEVFEAGNVRLVIKSKASQPSTRTSRSEPGVRHGREEKLPKTLEVVRKAVIDVLAHTDDMAEALERALESLGHRNSYWDQMMKELEVRGARRQALQVFRFLQDQPSFDLREQDCVTIISILGREGKLGLAREIFDSMRNVDITPSVHSYTVLMQGYAKQGLLKEAWEVFEAMKQEGCSPNVITYNTLINACAKNGYRLHKVVGLFEEMKHAGIQPNDITYNCMVNACVCQKLFKTASQILKEMKAVNCLPNVVSYTAMINLLGRSGKLDEAVELFEEMKELGRAPNSWTYNSLLKAYAREGCYEKAMGLYEEMEGAGCSPDLYTYNTVIDMCGRGGLFEEAEGVFLEMQRKGCTPDRVTYNTMLDAYSKGGHTWKAREVLEKMKRAGCAPDLWTYNILLDTAGKAGSVSEAMQIFQDLKTAGHSPNLVSFSAMINMYGRFGLFKEAQSVWGEMRAAGCVPNATAYCGLINSFSHHGMHKEALDSFKDMQKSGVEPDTQSYTTLMDAYGQAGLCDEAERLLERMEAAGFIADTVTYGVLVRAFAKAERFQEGLKYFEYVLQHSEPDHAPSQRLISQHSAAYEYHSKYLKQ